MVIRKSCHDINNEFNGFFNRPLKMFDQEWYNGSYMLSSVTFQGFSFKCTIVEPWKTVDVRNDGLVGYHLEYISSSVNFSSEYTKYLWPMWLYNRVSKYMYI
jgi:hypothetical protein